LTWADLKEFQTSIFPVCCVALYVHYLIASVNTVNISDGIKCMIVHLYITHTVYTTRAIWCCSGVLYLLSSPWFHENSSTLAMAAFHFNHRQHASINVCQWRL